jgi:redox-sensitive bicupin YhaK (pirin superfamily)
MSAGTGIRYSEFNAGSNPAKLFQIWLAARTGGTLPSWNTKSFPRADRAGRRVTLASPDTHDDGALRLDADARVLGGTFPAGSMFAHELPPGRRAYIVSTLGRVDLNGVRLEPRGGTAVTDERQLQFAMLDDTELIVVEMA